MTSYGDKSPTASRDGGLDAEDGYKAAVNHLRKADSVTMTPELFEKLYLSPQNNVKGDHRRTFGNPTPITLLGFVASITPLACNLMGWRGAGGSGVALNGVFYFMGGLTGILGGILEWVLGNTFSSVVFVCFGGFWFSFAATLTPAFNAYAPFAPADATSAAEGLQSPVFLASLAYWFVFMGLICLIFMVCSLMTNAIFVTIFFTLTLALSCMAGAYWTMAEDLVANAHLGQQLTVAAGAVLFVTSILGWYLFTSIMLASVDFPLSLPVGDLSNLITGQSKRQKAAINGEV